MLGQPMDCSAMVGHVSDSCDDELVPAVLALHLWRQGEDLSWVRQSVMSVTLLVGWLANDGFGTPYK
jgi:hypothetical protein